MPENARDRDELLLNAIVTGDTSGIDPRDREETFIKAIAEKKTGPFYPTGCGYYFLTDNNDNITGVYDYLQATQLDIEKIAPSDLIGEMLASDGTIMGSVLSVEFSLGKYYYRTVYATDVSIKFYIVDIDFINKTISYSAVTSITP